LRVKVHNRDKAQETSVARQGIYDVSELKVSILQEDHGLLPAGKKSE
jgi:hypothetical protein